MKTSRHLLSIGTLAILAALTYAQEGADRPESDGKEPARPPDPLLSALDTDGNGTVSREEIQKAATTLLALDKDKDGKLTREEFGGARPQDREGGGMAGRLDRDGDGKISREEAPSRLAERFDEIDTNGDGFLDREELAALRGGRGGRGEQPGGEGRRPRPDGERGPDGRDGDVGPDARPGEGGRGGAARMRRPERGSPLTRALDTDRDGTLSPAELENAATALKQLDKNGDGQLNKDELAPPRRGAGGFLARFDRDGDGKVSREEAPGRIAERFDTVDTNGDGFIDEAEMEQLMQRFRGRRPEGGRDRGPSGD